MIKQVITLLGLTTGALFAGNTAKVCPPEPGAPCYSVDESMCQYCLGPEQVNPAVGPLTCSGDWNVTIAGLYWKAHQDGMEFAIESNFTTPNDGLQNIPLIDAEYKTPDFKGSFGFKLGLSYTAARDGWDFGAIWTRYTSQATNHESVEQDDNTALIPLRILFPKGNFLTPFANDIESLWKLRLDLIDLVLGREFWTSRYLTLRPYVGIRGAYIDQTWHFSQGGGAYFVFNGARAYDLLKLKNNYQGVGVIGGLDTTWHMARGFSLFAHSAVSIVYGKFEVEYNERINRTPAPFTTLFHDRVEEKFRVSRYIVDLALGIQWATMFYDCKYGFSIGLAYEQHLFLNQNQFWRIQEVSPSFEKVYHQGRGDLDTQGVTLTVKFAF